MRDGEMKARDALFFIARSLTYLRVDLGQMMRNGADIVATAWIGLGIGIRALIGIALP